MCDETKTKTRSYEEVRLEPWWNQAPPFEVGNKIGLKHGLRAVSHNTVKDLDIDPQYLLDIEIDRRDFATLIMVLDTVILFSHAIMELIVETDDVRPLVMTAPYSELANKANELREYIKSRTLKVSRKYNSYSDASAERLWIENSERLKLLMDAMNQCHGILKTRKVRRNKAMEYDEKRKKWQIASWLKPYRDLMNSMVATVERLAMLMTKWTDLGSEVLDGMAEAIYGDW